MNRNMFFNIEGARHCFEQGGNVTEFLRKEHQCEGNSNKIIEVAYDLQTGSYIKYLAENASFFNSYIDEMKSLLQNHLIIGDTIMDVGTGEMTTFSLLFKTIDSFISRAKVFDISWSRVYKGTKFSAEMLGTKFNKIDAFVGSINQIPFADNSIDITISSHALEPNGANLAELLSELFRVTRRKIVLFEPCYEINSDEGKSRMERLGYIRGLENTVKALGGSMIDFCPMKTVGNPLNPTACFVIEPAKIDSNENLGNGNIYTVPGTSFELISMEDVFFAKEYGVAFPKINGLPVLRHDAAILATYLQNEVD